MILEDIMDELEKLPKGLADIYSEIYLQSLTQLGPKSGPIRDRILKWLLCAQRQLSTEELLAAVSVDSEGNFTHVSKEEALYMCCDFVILDEVMDVFRFAHVTIRDYLETRAGFSSEIAHSIAAERCLALWLATPLDRENAKAAVAQANDIFSQYATLHWASHCQASGSCLSQGVLGRLFNRFVLNNLDESQSFKEWKRLAMPYLKSMAWDDSLRAKLKLSLSWSPSTFFVGCIWGFCDLVDLSLTSSKARGEAVDVVLNSGLRVASEYGQYKVVKLLLERGGNTMAKDHAGTTALHVASSRGEKEIVELLLDKGSSKKIINAKDEDGRTALHQAAKEGHETIVRILLKKGAELNAKDQAGWTALHFAAEEGKKGVVMLLLEIGISFEAQDEFGCTALHLATERGREQIVRHLLEAGANVHAKDSHEWVALGRAAEKGHESIVRILLENGADIEAKSARCSTVHWAVERENENLLRILLDHGANIEANDDSGKTALHRAAERGNTAIVLQLLEANAKIDSIDKNGCTALYLATTRGHEEVTYLLLGKGANPTTKSNNKKTALHEASMRGYTTIVQQLLGSDIDIEAIDENGCTAAQLAILEGYESVARLLVKSDAKSAV